MIVRWVVFVIFAFAVTSTGYWRSCTQISQPQVVGYIALRAIPKNTRITSSLWSLQKGATPFASWLMPNPENLLGKYALRYIPAGMPITPKDLSESAQLVVAKDSVALTYDPVDLGPLSGYLNSGAKVYVCDQATHSCVGGPYKVEALVGKVDSPLVLICVTSAEADQLRKFSKPTLRLATLP